MPCFSPKAEASEGSQPFESISAESRVEQV
jgi:hypothetical protein